MSKIVMRLHLSAPKVRKRTVKAVQKHKDKTKYTRKCKHRPPVSVAYVLQSTADLVGTDFRASCP